MGAQRTAYRALALLNDAKAARRAVRTGSPRPLVRRAARRVYGRATGALARRLFG